jgi:cell division protein FtsW (lipid II flippase)
MPYDKAIKQEDMFLGLSAASTAVLFGAIGLVGLSLLMMFAIDAAEMAAMPNHLFRNQSLNAILGLGAMLAVRRTNYLRIGDYAYVLFGLTLVLLAAVLVFGFLGRYVPFIGEMFPNINGSYRWIRLKFFQIQPSEFIKITYILGLAMYLRYRKNYRRLGGLLGPFALTLLPMVLILLEPDLGTVMLLLPVLMIMLYAAGAKIRHLGAIVLLIICCVPILFSIMKPYQRSRVVGVVLQSQTTRDWLKQHPQAKDYLYPDKNLDQWHTSPAGYHLYHSKITIGTGGIVGCGYGKGPYMEGNKRLPECHNDFVFSIIAHQFGLVGSAAVIMLYLIMATGLVEIAGKTPDPFGRLIAVGILALLLMQAGINIGMTLGLMPITGLTLPFVSYGGSSMLTFCILIGLALSVDRFRPIHIGPKPFEFEDDD